MSSINVSVARPRRLLFVEQEWTLELERWQVIDRDIFRPVLSYVPGADNVLRYLSELDQSGHLLAQAERLVAQPGQANTAYEAHDGHWVAQLNVAESPVAPSVRRPSTESTDLSLLLSHLSALQERMERLELRLQGRIADNDAPAPSVRPMSSSSEIAGDTNDEDEPISQTG